VVAEEEDIRVRATRAAAHEIDRFNGLVATLEVTEKLAAVGAFEDVAERARLLAALRSTRDELVRLLRGASSPATLALVPSEAARVQVSAAARSRMLRDTLAVAASVREEVKRLETAQRLP
jgi:hypothetical protein